MKIEIQKSYEMTIRLNEEEAWAIKTALMNVQENMAYDEGNPYTPKAMMHTSNELHDKFNSVIFDAEEDIKK